MIKEFCDAWYAKKDDLRAYLAKTPQMEYQNYASLVQILFKECINPYLKEHPMKVRYSQTTRFFEDGIHEIDDGDYQGTLLYLVPRCTYQPDAEDYVYTKVYYGSCSCCDTLQGIHDYMDGLPSERQLNDYMELMLDILQECKWLVPREEKNDY